MRPAAYSGDGRGGWTVAEPVAAAMAPATAPAPFAGIVAGGLRMATAPGGSLSLSPMPEAARQAQVAALGSLSLSPMPAQASALARSGGASTARVRAVSPIARPVQRMVSHTGHTGHTNSASNLHALLQQGAAAASGVMSPGGVATVAFAQAPMTASLPVVTMHAPATVASLVPPATISHAPPVGTTWVNMPMKSEEGLFGDDELRSEIESLRRTLRVQEERIARLRQDLVSAQEGEAKRRAESEVARAEVTRLVEELRLERAAREQAEALAYEQQAATEAAALAAQPGARLAVGAKGGSPPRSPKGAVQRVPSRGASARRQRSESGAATPVQQGIGTRSDYSGSVDNGHPTSGRRTGAQRSARPQQQASVRDDIDEKLTDAASRANSRIQFRRLNRGWYAFRTTEDEEERHVEMSVVNGKLMARVDPLYTFETAWNNGKLGAIERFLAQYALPIPTA